LDPSNGEYERGLGWAILNGGDKMEGISHLYRAKELSPSNVHVLTDLGTAMLMLEMQEFERYRAYPVWAKLLTGECLGRVYGLPHNIPLFRTMS
jgi:hypothetical protein